VIFSAEFALENGFSISQGINITCKKKKQNTHIKQVE